jgi:hypothetical protein
MTPDQEEPLTFNWPGHGHVSLAFPGFIILSLLLHLAAFYVFRIVYPVSASILAPPATLTLVTPQTEGSGDFLRWLASRDLVGLSRTRDLTPPALLELPYHPTYEKSDAQPLPVKEHAQPVPYPPVRNPLGLSLHKKPDSLPGRKTVPGLRTVLTFSGALENRAPASAPPPAIKGEATMEPVRFLIGADDRGKVQHAFLQVSSGNTRIDLQAEAHLKTLSLKPAAEPLAWGMVSFHWGVDALETAQLPAPARP